MFDNEKGRKCVNVSIVSLNCNSISLVNICNSLLQFSFIYVCVYMYIFDDDGGGNRGSDGGRKARREVGLGAHGERGV